MKHEIYLVDNNEYLLGQLKRMFTADKDYTFKQVQLKDLDTALKEIPSLIIVNEDTIDENVLEICLRIKNNEDNGITPLIVVSSNHDGNHVIDVLTKEVEHYVLQPLDEKYLYFTIKNTINLLYTNRRVSPLTGLPGNVQIQAEMKKRLLKKETFLMLYFDLDNFKAYNDVYGFFMGDEIIKFTAKTITKFLHTDDLEGSFVGHIGGDDFVGIISVIDDYEKLCEEIISYFDENIKKFFSEIDVNRGYLEVANRKGIIEQFPLTSISIGVVEVDSKRFKNVLQIGEIGAQVKHQAKVTPGSAYAIDRRRKVQKK